MVAFLLFRASQRVPEFYQRAIQIAPVAQQQASDEMLQKAGDLANHVKKQGKWEALFTDAQINGWLAVDLPKNHPNSLPAEIREPRVVIEPGRFTVAFRLVQGKWNTVISLVLEPSVPEPNVLALRIRKARGGEVPLPLDRILKEVTKAAERMDLRLEWRQADGDPVALFSVPPPRDNANRLIQLDTLRLGQGELYVSGTTTER